MNDNELLVAWSTLAALLMLVALTAAGVMAVLGRFVPAVSLSLVAVAAAACFLLLEWGRPSSSV